MNEPGAGGPGRSLASGDMSCFGWSSSARAHGTPRTSTSSPASERLAYAFRFIFALSSADFEFSDVLMGVGDPFVLGPLHVCRGEDEIHEVHGLRPAADAHCEPVGARLGHLRRRVLVVG